MSEIIYRKNSAHRGNIAEHFNNCDEDFLYDLSGRVVMSEYIEKILKHAQLYEAWDLDRLVGFLALYTNPEFHFITNISVVKDYNGKGIASKLLENCIANAKHEIRLEVREDNKPALKLYKKFGFNIYKQTSKWNFLVLKK